ncbi:MAG: DUF488 family protein [Acetobacteraceae bacterium]
MLPQSGYCNNDCERHRGLTDLSVPLRGHQGQDHRVGLRLAMRACFPFYTVGHSTRSLAELAALLIAPGIDCLADVRTIPRSRTNPEFNADVLPETLVRYGIGYRHLPKLGGLRAGRSDGRPSANGLWRNASFRNYADYAETAEFQDGLSRLRELGREHTVAIMCAEAVWWRCHRRIIADYLLASGEEVFHLLGAGKIQPAEMTPGAKRMSDGRLVYPAVVYPAGVSPSGGTEGDGSPPA